MLGGMRGLAIATLLLGTGVAAAAPYPAVWLPRQGDGYLVPETWAARGLSYGRPELVGLVERAAARVAGELEGALLYVADLSLRSGARTPWHRSHRDGRDADLIFYAVHENGEPVEPPEVMVPFDDQGLATLPDGRVIRFDVPRNWALVQALLEDDGARVAKIFVSAPLRRLLLVYAIGVEARPAVLARAALTLVEPTDSLPHDDHFHIRIDGPPVAEKPRVVLARKVVKPGKKDRPVAKAPARATKRRPGRR
jgi:penicillin-insensitive murein endopeptidase